MNNTNIIISFIREFLIRTIGFRRTRPLSTEPITKKFEKIRKEMGYVIAENKKFAEKLKAETEASMEEMRKMMEKMQREAESSIAEANREAEIAGNWEHNLGIMGTGKIAIKETQKK